ncbi:hypothetical protein [Microbacterium dauci]|uniref:Uncharacterized protein n=1 Tax=Microbacterium dauci TaxID=3048008 RepID=A0ABT6ZGS3_9MICO|nr:hypothetical protein [Microbacterium sp. LX3-4]MDJ1115349.1 hypothetical protein [Microbacterium sp. LX3-4]
MTGTTPNGIRYPDGASKAKNLGAELQQMAEDIDEFIDEQFDGANPAFAQRAGAAVDAALATRQIVTHDDRLAAGEGRPALAIPFEKGGRRYRNALEVDDHGRPTEYALGRHAAAEALYGELGKVIGVETRRDVHAPGKVALFVYDTGEVAGSISIDGTTTFAESDTTADVARGDSTTYGADLANPTVDGWCPVLSRMANRPIVGWGRSGARAEEITFMGGGLWITGAPAGGSIPAAGAVTITGLDVDPWRAGVTAPVPVLALTPAGVSIPGTLERIGDTRVFTRQTPGAVVPAASLQFRGNPRDKHRLLYVGMGINNEPLIEAGTQTIADVQGWYEDLTRGHTGPLVIWGLLDRGISEAPGTVRGDFIAAMETWFAAEYGDAWCPVRQYLASSAAIADAGAFASYAPTQADLDHVAAGVVPPGFRTGGGTSVHLNELGNWLQAWFILHHLIERGLI